MLVVISKPLVVSCMIQARRPQGNPARPNVAWMALDGWSFSKANVYLHTGNGFLVGGLKNKTKQKSEKLDIAVYGSILALSNLRQEISSLTSAWSTQ